MLKFISILFLSISVLVTGCSMFNYKTGTRITDQQLQTIVKGQTTSSDVLHSFGQPTKIFNTNEGDQYLYEYSVIKSFGKNTNEAVTVILNKKGVVTDYIVNRNANNTSNPLLDAANKK